MVIEIPEDIKLEDLLNGSFDGGILPHIDLSWFGHLISWLICRLYYACIVLVLFLMFYLVVLYLIMRPPKKLGGIRRWLSRVKSERRNKE